MAYDVFISYSSVDLTAADTVCSILEQNGIRCWIAPRDITPGLDFAEAIIDGIKSSKLFILVFSSSSGNSKQVIREVDRAVHTGIPIINLRLEEVPLSKQLEYYLSSVHWLDAMTPPLEEHINKLSGVVKILLRKDNARDGDLRKAIQEGTLRGRSDKKSLAVLPFKNDSPDEENTYFINGLMEEILNNLQKIKDLRVISRTSVEQYRNQTKPIPEIAKELGVNYIVEGSGQKYGNSFRLRTQLIMAEHEAHIWGESFQQKITNVEDIFNIQIKIAESIAEELKAVISPVEKQLIEKIPTMNLTAYDEYLKGKFYVNNVTPDDIDMNTAMDHFEQAKERDPEFPLAYAGIAQVWMVRQQMGFASPDQAGPKITEAIERVLELDIPLAEVHYILASSNFLVMWNWEAAETEYKKVLEINPNHPETHGVYSHLLIILGRTEEAMQHAELSLKLDPHNLWTIMWYSFDLLSLHRYDECITLCREFYEKNQDAYWMLLIGIYLALHMKKEYDEAYKTLKMATCIQYKDFDHVFDQYEKLGYSGTLNLEADTLLAQSRTKYVSQFDLAVMYSFAGNKQRTLDCLEQAYEMRDPVVPYIGVYPNFVILGDEPRYQELLRKINVPDNNQVAFAGKNEEQETKNKLH